MGKLKEAMIDQLNQNPDDIDWNVQQFTTMNEGPMYEAQQSDGKKMWKIKSTKDNVEYKIWAYTYQQALNLLPMIESF